MTTRARSWLGALFLAGEALILATHQDEARALARTIYVATWQFFTPDLPVPDRFLSERR